jgi:predicted MFS family arabinose efflux permease
MPSGPPARAGSEAPPRRRRLLVAVAALWLFTVMADQSSLSPLLPLLTTRLGVDPEAAGFLVTAYALGAAALQLALGPVADRRGARPVLLLGGAAFLTGSLGAAFMPPYAAFLGLRFLAGLGAGAVSLGAVLLVSDLYPYGERATPMGWAMTGLLVAPTVGPILAGQLALFAALAAVALPILLAGSRGLGAPADLGPPAGFVRSYAALLHRAPPLGSLLASALFSGAVMGIAVNLTWWLQSRFALSTAQIASVYAAGGLGALLGGPWGGRLGDRAGNRRMVGVTSLLFLLTLAALVPLRHALWANVTAAFAAYLWESLRRGPFQSLMTGIVERSQVASFVALKNSAAQLGIALSVPLMTGLLRSQGDFAPVCLAGAALTGFGLCALYAWVPEPSTGEAA